MSVAWAEGIRVGDLVDFHPDANNASGWLRARVTNASPSSVVCDSSTGGNRICIGSPDIIVRHTPAPAHSLLEVPGPLRMRPPDSVPCPFCPRREGRHANAIRPNRWACHSGHMLDDEDARAVLGLQRTFSEAELRDALYLSIVNTDRIPPMMRGHGDVTITYVREALTLHGMETFYTIDVSGATWLAHASSLEPNEHEWIPF